MLSAVDTDEDNRAVAGGVVATFVSGCFLRLVTVDELHGAQVNVDGLLPRGALVFDGGPVHQPVGRPLEAAAGTPA